MPPDPAARPVFTTGQIAKIIHCSPKVVGRWCDAGLLAHYRLPPPGKTDGGDRRVLPAALLAFLRAHAMPVPAGLEAAGQSPSGLASPPGEG